MNNNSKITILLWLQFSRKLYWWQKCQSTIYWHNFHSVHFHSSYFISFLSEQDYCLVPLNSYETYWLSRFNSLTADRYYTQPPRLLPKKQGGNLKIWPHAPWHNVRCFVMAVFTQCAHRHLVTSLIIISKLCNYVLSFKLPQLWCLLATFTFL